MWDRWSFPFIKQEFQQYCELLLQPWQRKLRNLKEITAHIMFYTKSDNPHQPLFVPEPNQTSTIVSHIIKHFRGFYFILFRKPTCSRIWRLGNERIKAYYSVNYWGQKIRAFTNLGGISGSYPESRLLFREQNPSFTCSFHACVLFYSISHTIV